MATFLLPHVNLAPPLLLYIWIWILYRYQCNNNAFSRTESVYLVDIYFVFIKSLDLWTLESLICTCFMAILITQMARENAVDVVGCPCDIV